jgi:hypothetical protein
MRMTRGLYLGAAMLALALAMATSPAQLKAQTTPPGLSVGAAEIGGIVTGPTGPEAGVWVIAETTDLPTKYAKIVVTDDQGRYMIPELPKAKYKVWVRGYGLIDSAKVDGEPGKLTNLTAVKAPNEAAAAEYYPQGYWYALMKFPDKGEFPGTGDSGNRIPTSMRSQHQWLDSIKTNGCWGCHGLGNKATRTIPEDLGSFESSHAAWTRRIQSGQAMNSMIATINRFGAQRGISYFADWTDRIAKGELPFAKPERPQGIERNIVVTLWDWGREKAYLHDEIATDRRNPRVNANGKVYGSPEYSTDWIPILDPVTHTKSEVKIGVLDPKTPSSKDDPMAPSPYYGDEKIWDSQTNSHNPMMDQLGRTWFTSQVRPAETEPFCQQGSSHPSAKAFPTKQASRHAAMYDPKANKFTLVATCFGTHHLHFAEDASNTLWFSGGAQVLGWINTKMLDETGDTQKSQGWTAFVVDTNGDGKRGEYTEPNQPIDPNKDRRLSVGTYGIGVAPDGGVWTTVRVFPGFIMRTVPGSDPANTALTEIYEVPFDDAKTPGYGPRGMDVDRNGVVWTPLSSGHMASFDRRKCKVLNGPTAASGRHCSEGWTLYPFPGPQFKDFNEPGSVESSYYTWVDQFNVSGLGANTPMATGNANESILALVDGKWVNMRVPYPLGFYTKGMDGRVDDPNTGWKGRGIWTTYGQRTPFHLEGGKGTLPKVVKFQIRPDPLAR